MDKYNLKILPKVYRNLDEIYYYISDVLQSTQSAINLVDDLEKAIFSLEFIPYRGSKRRTGTYSSKDYRQIFVKNFTIIYRINGDSKEVVVANIRYTKSEM